MLLDSDLHRHRRQVSTMSKSEIVMDERETLRERVVELQAEVAEFKSLLVSYINRAESAERQVLALKPRVDVMQQLCDIKSLGVWRVQRWEVPSNELVPNDEMARYVTVPPEELFNELLQSKQEAKL